jgi:putative heme-binding domain-containing protein
MPRIGSNQVDERATRMIHDWIVKLAAPATGTPVDGKTKLGLADRSALESLKHADRLSSDDRSAAIGRLASSTRGALMLLGLVDRPHASASLRRDSVEIARNSSLVEVRDLFERFIPEQERVKRLGDIADRTAILALVGDSMRGRSIFSSNASVQCKSCHRAGEVGENIGPDLTKIGTKFNKAALLEQILEPSKTIEPAFMTYAVETKDGQVLSGLLVERAKGELTLKGAKGETIKVPNANIEQFLPQSRSMMPELLLRDLTAQQTADLLEFLASLR